MTNKTERVSLDIPTLIALAVFAWIIFNVLHTVVGHGGACILRGDKLVATTMTHAACADIDVTFWGGKFYFAAGHLVNAIAAVIFLGLVPLAGTTRPTLHYFLWISACFNIFNVGNAIMVAPMKVPYGDWWEFSDGLKPLLLWRYGLAVVGVIIVLIGFLQAIRLWRPLIGGDDAERRRRIKLLTRIPCATAFVVSVLAGLPSPLRFEAGLLQALLAPVSVFWLLFLPLWPRGTRDEPPHPAMPLKRSIPWIVVAIIAFIIYVGVLGPGIGTFPKDLLR